jgi:hypothetical protein
VALSLSLEILAQCFDSNPSNSLTPLTLLKYLFESERVISSKSVFALRLATRLLLPTNLNIRGMGREAALSLLSQLNISVHKLVTNGPLVLKGTKITTSCAKLGRPCGEGAAKFSEHKEVFFRMNGNQPF